MQGISSTSEIIGLFTRVAPTDVFGLAAALDLEVRSVELPDSVSGSIRKSWRGSRFEVEINDAHHLNRRRFTLAHEIAHFVLHRDLIGDGITDDALYRSDRGSEIEGQANAYAATLLMPATLVKQAFREGVKSYADMARKFEVSPEVARIRMRELRLGG